MKEEDKEFEIKGFLYRLRNEPFGASIEFQILAHDVGTAECIDYYTRNRNTVPELKVDLWTTNVQEISIKELECLNERYDFEVKKCQCGDISVKERDISKTSTDDTPRTIKEGRVYRIEGMARPLVVGEIVKSLIPKYYGLEIEAYNRDRLVTRRDFGEYFDIEKYSTI